MKCKGAGELRNRVTIQSVAKTADGGGGYADVWSDVYSAWAAIKPVNGLERIQAMQMETPVTHHIMMRYDSRLTTAHRIKFGSRYFNVNQVINVAERGEWLDVVAIEGTAT